MDLLCPIVRWRSSRCGCLLVRSFGHLGRGKDDMRRGDDQICWVGRTVPLQESRPNVTSSSGDRIVSVDMACMEEELRCSLLSIFDGMSFPREMICGRPSMIVCPAERRSSARKTEKTREEKKAEGEEKPVGQRRGCCCVEAGSAWRW